MPLPAITPEQRQYLRELQARCRSVDEAHAMILSLQVEIDGLQEDADEDQARGQSIQEWREYGAFLRGVVTAWLDDLQPSGRGRRRGNAADFRREMMALIRLCPPHERTQEGIARYLLIRA
jgi:hypothetical protein